MHIHRPVTIGIVFVLLCAIVLFLVFVGTIFILDTTYFAIGLSFYALGLTTALFAFGLWHGRCRKLTIIYITIAFFVSYGFSLIIFMILDSLPIIIITGISVIIVYIFIISCLTSNSCKKFCEIYGENVVLISPVERSISDTKNSQQSICDNSQDGLERRADINHLISSHGEELNVDGYSSKGEKKPTIVTFGSEIRSTNDNNCDDVNVSHESENDVGYSKTNDAEVFKYCIYCGFDLIHIPNTAKHCPRCGRTIMWGDFSE